MKHPKTLIDPDTPLARLNIRISGSGGQGVISAAMLLGTALALGDGRTVAQSQAYGPEARGGACRADVIVSDDEIFFPECDQLDLLVALTAEAYDRFAAQVRSTGLIIADTDAVDVLAGSAPTRRVPLLETAHTHLGDSVGANILVLGYLATATGIVSIESLQQVIAAEYAGSSHLERNQQALQAGIELGRRQASA